MFDWQATQTQPCLFSTLSKGESHFRSLVCIMRNSKYASTSIMCTLRNSKCAFRIKIQNTHFAVVWKQSKLCQNWQFLNQMQERKFWWFDNSIIRELYFGILWCWGLKFLLMCPSLLDLIGVGKGCTLVGGISNVFAAHSWID